jgi:hypothetical protein
MSDLKKKFREHKQHDIPLWVQKNPVGENSRELDNPPETDATRRREPTSQRRHR